ncbi:MAG: TonB-dependent receptor domain-containing protein [Sphingobacteriales bacterium]|jgi:outer membrane receptor protein involved in Fe transport
MRIFLLFFSFLLTSALYAQPPAGINRTMPGGQSMNIGRFYGKVVDAQTNKPVDAASIQLIQTGMDSITKQKKEKIISGQLTTANGNFALENIPVIGKFRLKITAIGYVLYDQEVSFGIKPGTPFTAIMNSADKDLGNIKLTIDSKQLDEIKITGSKPFMQMGVDRRIFNVEKSLVSQGQTATELMRNIPGLNVDIDGNVTMRNASPTIFVDGRPTTLTLDQIPADAIASVEMITNPSAKYDASGGMAGILNVVLKKNRKAGYNGNFRIGIDSRARVNGGGDINVRQGKFNYFLSGMYNQRKTIGTGQSYRQETYSTPNIIFNQANNPIGTGSFRFMRGGIDYFIDNRNTLTLSGNMVRGSFDNTDDLDIKTDSLYNSGLTSFLSKRDANSSFYFKNNNVALGYKRLFQKSGMELTSDINYSLGSNGSNNAFNTRYFDLNNNPKGLPINQQQNGKGSNDNFTFQTDFVNPISEDGKIEIGARASIRNVKSENLNYIQNPITGELTPIVAVNANFRYNEQVYAAYASLSSKIGKTFSYQTGLRAESSTYEGELITNGSRFKNSFPISLFPSVFLTQKLSDKDDLQLSYSRRINRPNFFQLLPFVDYTDSLNISRGNPGLIPEFTSSFELSYQKNLKKGHSVLFTGWFKYTNNLITRYQIKEPSAIPGRDVIINTYINANNSRAYGLEATFRNPLTRWLEVTTNLNFYNSKINTDNLASAVKIDDLWSFFGKMNMAFKLPKNYSIQLTGDYQSRTILPQGGGGSGRGGGMGMSGGMRGGGGGGWGGFVQTTAQGYVKPNYSLDFAIRKEFLKEKKGSLSLSINDLFKTRRYATYSESDFFVQEFSRRQDWRVIRLNFSYRFGKFDQTLFKRKNNRMESGQDNMQMQ